MLPTPPRWPCGNCAASHTSLALRIICCQHDLAGTEKTVLPIQHFKCRLILLCYIFIDCLPEFLVKLLILFPRMESSRRPVIRRRIDDRHWRTAPTFDWPLPFNWPSAENMHMLPPACTCMASVTKEWRRCCPPHQAARIEHLQALKPSKTYPINPYQLFSQPSFFLNRPFKQISSQEPRHFAMQQHASPCDMNMQSR